MRPGKVAKVRMTAAGNHNELTVNEMSIDVIEVRVGDVDSKKPLALGSIFFVTCHEVVLTVIPLNQWRNHRSTS